MVPIEGLFFRIRRIFRRILRVLPRTRKVFCRIPWIFGSSLGRGAKINLPIYALILSISSFFSKK